MFNLCVFLVKFEYYRKFSVIKEFYSIVVIGVV